jgi:hypothetical protein
MIDCLITRRLDGKQQQPLTKANKLFATCPSRPRCATPSGSFVDAFEGAGGVAALTASARENRTEFYRLYARLIPVEHTGAKMARS